MFSMKERAALLVFPLFTPTFLPFVSWRGKSQKSNIQAKSREEAVIGLKGGECWQRILDHLSVYSVKPLNVL